MNGLPEQEEEFGQNTWVSFVASNKILSYKLRRQTASAFTALVFGGVASNVLGFF